MISLASITVATVGFGWWNWRGVLRSSAASTAEYLAMSAERLRRMRLAWRIGWLVLSAQFVVFAIWIWEQLVFRRLPARPCARNVLRGHGWRALTIAAVIGAGVWPVDHARHEALRGVAAGASRRT